MLPTIISFVSNITNMHAAGYFYIILFYVKNYLFVPQVETVGERIVLYILNRVIYRAKEMSSEELPFLCHGEKDYAKILWNDGEAVGFYSVKPSGKFYNVKCINFYRHTSTVTLIFGL